MMDFKDLNDALVKVLKIDPQSKKARQYAGYNVNGDKITFSMHGGREITYSTGAFDGDYSLFDVKTPKENSINLSKEDMLKQIKETHWKYGGPLGIGKDDIDRYNEEKLLDILAAETEANMRSQKEANKIKLNLKKLQATNEEIKNAEQIANKINANNAKRQENRKKIVNLSKKMVKGENVYKEVQKTWDETMQSFKKGIGSSGKSTYKTIDSGYETVSKEYANLVRSGQINTFQIKGMKKSSGYTNIKNNYSISDVKKMKKAYYDFETIGDIGTNTFMPTQLSVLRQGANGGKDNVQTAIFQLGGQQLKYIEGLLNNLKKNVALSEAEKRSLLAMTGYTLNDKGEVSARHISYNSKVNLSRENKELIQQIENGIKILSNAEGTVKGLISYDKMEGYIRETFNQIKKNGEYAVGHNVDVFDSNVAKIFKANLDKLNSLDTLGFIKNNFKIGHQNKNGKRLFGYSQGTLANYFGIDLKALSEKSGLTQHTAEFDIKLNQKILDAAIVELETITPNDIIKQFTVSENQVGIAQKSGSRKSPYSFKTDAQNHVKGKEAGGDLLFQRGHNYQFLGVLEKEIDKVLRKFVKYQDVETGDFIYSYMDTDSSHIDEFADIFDGSFKEIDKIENIGAKDAVLSMFKNSTGLYNLESFVGGGAHSSVQKKRFENLKKSKEFSGSSELLGYISNYLQENASDIISTSQIGSSLMSAIGTEMGIKQGHIYSVGDLKKQIGIDNKGMSVGKIKAKITNFIEDNYKVFNGGNEFAKEALKEITAMNITEESMRTGDGSALVHGFSKWLFDNLEDKYKKSNSQTSDLGKYFDFVKAVKNGSPEDLFKINKIMDKEIEYYRSHFMNTGTEISDILAKGDGIAYNGATSLKDKLTGQDTKNRLKKMGVDVSKIGSRLGIYDKNGDTDANKFDENSLGGILSLFREKIQGSNIGSHISLTEDGKSLRVGVFHSSKFKDVYDDKNNPLWEAMQGVIDIGLGDDDILKMNGMDYINYLMPFLTKEKNIQMGTAREFLAKEVLNSIFTKKNQERLANGEDIQGSLNYFAKEVIQNASSGGTYKNMTDSFYREAIDAIRAGATPEQKAVRGSATSMARLFEDIAKDAGYELGEGYDKSKNLENLMMYTTAMAFDKDDYNFVEAMELENNEHLFINTNTEARKKFKAKIKQLTDAGDFSLEGLKAQSFLSQITNYIGARDITPMSFLNSAQGRNTDQFFNYLGRKRDVEKLKDGRTQRQAGYASGLLKNYMTTESGSTILGKDDYLQQDIYDQFIMGYTDDYRLSDAFNNEEFIKNVPEAIRNVLKNISVWEGGAIVSQSAANNLNAYRTQTEEIKDLDQFKGTDLIKKLRNLELGDRLDGKDLQITKDISIAGIDFSSGDILKGIQRTSKGYLVEYDKREKAKVGSKFTGEGGNRNTIAAIVDDTTISWINKMIGTEGAHILTQRADLKGTNISEQIGGRISYIMNTVLSEATDKKTGEINKDKLLELQNKVKEAVNNSGNEKLKKMFNRMFELDDKTGLLKSIGMHTSQGYKYKKDGILHDLFDKDSKGSDKEDRDYLFSGQFVTDLGKTTLGNKFNENLVASAMALSNIYEIKDPLGGGDIEDIYATSKYKIGGRERAAIESRLNFAQHAYQNQGETFKKLREYMKDWSSPKGASYSEAEKLKKSYAQAWKDNLSLNKSGNKGKPLASQLGDINEGNVFEILADGTIAEGNQFLLSDIFSTESGDFIKGMTQEDFHRIIRGRIIDKMKEIKGDNFDVGKSKVILNLGEYAATLDDGRKINQLALSLGAYDFKDGERITYNENDKTLRDLMSNLYNFDINGKNAQSYVNESVKSYLSVLKSAEDKNSKVFENLKTAKVGNSMSGHVHGVNLAQSKEWGDNTVGIHSSSIRKMLSGLSAEALDNLYYGNFSELSGVDLNSETAKKDLIKRFIEQMKSGKTLTGIGHRYPTTDSEALWFSDVRLDDSVGKKGMRFGLGMSTGFNADYDGDTGYLALPFTDLVGKSKEEVKEIFDQVNLVKQMNTDVGTMIGDWTRNNEEAKANELWKRYIEDQKKGRKVSLPSGIDVGEQIANADVEGILSILSKHNFGHIGNFSTFATKYRTMASKRGLNTRFDSESGIKDLANSKIISAFFELTEQDAISAKKIGQKLKFKDGKVDMNAIVSGLDEYSSLLYNTKFKSAEEKSIEIVKKAQDLGLINEKMKGRQATQAIAMIQRTVAQNMGFGDDYYNDAVVKAMSERYGIEGLTSNGSTGSISANTLVKALTTIQDEFGGVSGFVKELNSVKSKELTGTYDKDKISKQLTKDLGEIWTDNSTDSNAPKVVDGENISGENGQFANITVESMRVGTIIAENGILESSASGQSLGTSQNTKTYISNAVGGISQVTHKGDSSILYNPQKAWNPNDISSQIEHLKSSDSIFEYLGLQKLTEDDIKNPIVENVWLDETGGGHVYKKGNKNANYDISASQLSSIMDITKPYSSNFANEWFASTLKELASNGKISLDFINSDGEKETREFTNVEDIYKVTNNKNWLNAAKMYRATEMGTAMHKLMELTHGKARMDIKGALESEEMNSYKNNLARLGMTGNITEELEERYNQFNNLLGSLGVKNAKLLTEKSHLITYGKGDSALRISGTFDAAYEQLLMDYKNEGTLNTPAHALQLEILADMLKNAYGDKLSSNKDEIKRAILASFGADKNFNSGILNFGAMDDATKLRTLNQIKANSAMQKFLGTQGFNPVVENGVLKYLSGPSFSKANYEAYQNLQLLLSNDKQGKEFDNALSGPGGLGFEFKNRKDLGDGLQEWTYSFFDEITKKQLDVSLVKDIAGKIISDKTKFSEVDLSDDYEKLRKEYLGHLSKRSLFEASIKEEELKGDNKDIIKIAELNAARWDEIKAIENLSSNANSAIFRGLETSGEVQGYKDFQENESADANKGRVLLNNLRDRYLELTEAQKGLALKKHSGIDEKNLEKDREKIDEIRGAIEKAQKALDKWNRSNMDSITDNEKAAVMQMSNAAKVANIQETSEFASSLYSPEEIKNAQKTYLDDLNRIADLEREILKLKNKNTYGREDRERNSRQIADAEAELNLLNKKSTYDAENGILLIGERDINGNIKTDENGNIIQDRISLKSADKIDFERRISEEQTKNIQKQNDLVRDSQKLGFFGQLKASMTQAMGHLGVASAGYTIIGAFKQQVSKVTQLTIQLDKTMTDLSIVTGKNRKEVTELMRSYNGLANAIGLTTSEVSTSANEWLRMGYRTEEVNTLVKNSAMLAKLGMIEIGQATEYMTSAMKGYGVSVKDSMSIVDMATGLDMKYAVSAGYILEAMSRTATSAKLAKVEMADLQSMIAIVGETSQKDASVVGESFKTAFARYGNVKANAFLGNSDLTSLEDQYSYENNLSESGDYDSVSVNDIEKVLKRLEIPIRNGDEWRSYSDILSDVGKNFKLMSDYEKNAITTAMFGTRQRENGLIVLENYNKVLEAKKIAEESSGTATAKYLKYQDSLEASTNRLTASYEKFVLGLQGSGTIKDILDILAFSLENIRVIITGISVGFLALNWDRTLKYLTLINGQLNKMSLHTIGQGIKGNGPLKDVWNNTIEKSYEKLNSSGIAQQKLSPTIYARMNGDQKGYIEARLEELKAERKKGNIHKNTTDKNLLKRAQREYTDMTDEEKFKYQKQVSVSSYIDTAGQVIGAFGGSQIGSEMGKAFGEAIGSDESTWQAIGSMIGMYITPQVSSGIASVLGKGLGPIGQSFIGAGLSIAATIGAAIYKNWKKGIEEAEKAQADLVEKSKEKIDKYSSSENQTKFENYDKLAKGVNQFGENISLSNDEYEEFISLGNELAEVFPNLVVKTDKFGNSLLGADNEIGNLTNSVSDLIKVEQQRMYKANIENPEKGDSIIQKAFDNLLEKRQQINNKWLNQNISENPTAKILDLVYDKDLRKKDIKNAGMGFLSELFLKTSEIIDDLPIYNFMLKKTATNRNGYFEKSTTSDIIRKSEIVGENIGNISLINNSLSDNKKEEYDKELKDRISKIVFDYNKAYWNDNKTSEEEQKRKFFGVQTNDLMQIEYVMPSDTGKKIAEEFITKCNNEIELLDKRLLEDYKKEIDEQTKSFVKEFLPSILGSNMQYSSLPDNIKSFVSDLAQNLDPLNYNNAEDYMNAVVNNYVKPLKDNEQEFSKISSEIVSFSKKEHLGVNLSLSESDKKYTAMLTAVKDIYDTNSDAFKSKAEELGYEYKDGKYQHKTTKDIINPNLDVDKSKKFLTDVYSSLIGGENEAENILEEIKTKSGYNSDIFEQLTIEEARWVSKHSEDWLKRQNNAENIVAKAQRERISSISTTKDRLQTEAENKKQLEQFEDLIQAGKNITDIKTNLGLEKDDAFTKQDDAFTKQLELMDKWAKSLGISLKEAYNQASNLSAINKFGFTSKTVQQITDEASLMKGIASASVNGTVTAEQLSALYAKDANYANYSGDKLSKKILDELGYTTLISASIGGTLANSDEFFKEVIDKYKNKDVLSKVNTYQDILSFEDYFDDAKINGKYQSSEIERIINENSQAKDFLISLGIDVEAKDGLSEAEDIGNVIKDIKTDAEALMKIKIAKQIEMLEESKVKSTNKAFRDLKESIEDINRELKELEKQNALNKLQSELEKIRLTYQKFDKELNIFDWGFEHLGSTDFGGKTDVLEEKLDSLIEKNKSLADAMDVVNSKTPKTAEEASALKEEYESLSTAYIDNQKALIEIQEQMSSLGVNMLSDTVGKNFEALNKQMKTASEYASLSNLRTYTGGATGLLNYNLSGTLESKNEVDRKESEYEKLLKMQKKFNEESLKLNQEYIRLKEKQDQEEYQRQKSELVKQKRDALVEFYINYQDVIEEYYPDSKEVLGITDADIDAYWGDKMLIKDEQAQQRVKDLQTKATTYEKDKEKEDNKGGKEPKAKTPTIEGTDAKVDTPESVSNHIIETMKAGIEDANLEMAENSKDYGIKAPPLNDSSWGMTIDSGLGLKFRNAYLVIMKALNEYIENTDNQDAKLSAPALRWKDPRGWENNLVKRMKTKTDEAIGKVNEYLTNGESVKLQAPKIDEETWVKLGRLMAGCISAGMNENLDGFSGNLQENIMNEADLSKKSDVGFINPVQVERAKITSKYGKRKSTTTKNGKQSSSYHQAIDIGGGINGVEIYAVADGEIIFSGEKGGYGNCVQILHDNGYITQYAHMQKASSYKVGQRIKQGDVVGYVGETGNSTGPHLDFKVQKNGKWVNPEKYIPGYAYGTNSHKGGLALIGDEGLVNNKSGLFPELVILPNGEIALMGTQGPVLANLPKGTEVLNNTDTNEFMGVNSYADGTGVDNLEIKELTVTGDLTVEGNENVSGDLNTGDEQYKSVIDESKVSDYAENFENYLDQITGERENTQRILEETYKKNNYKIPVLSEYERLANQAIDPTTRYSYKLIRDLYSRDDEISNYKMLANDAAKKYNEALYNMGLAIEQGADVEVVKAWSEIVDKYKDQMIEAEQAIENSLDATMQAFQTFADEVDGIYNNIKENLDLDYENGWLGEKTSSNYYNPLKEAAEERVKGLEKAYNGALQAAINKYLKIGYDIELATSKAMEEEGVKALAKERKNAVRERTQIELDQNNDRIANYERANQKIDEQLGYNSNLSDSQFREVYADTLANTRRMISEDKRALKNIENMSPEDQKALIDRMNQNTKGLIDITSTYIDNILNRSKRLTDASVNERDKKLSVGGITTYDENGKSIFEKNIEDFKEEGEAIAQAIADTRYILTQEAKYNGLTDEDEIEEYINNNEKMISLNEQNLDNLKKQAEEHRKILDYTLEQIDNQKKLLDLSKENEWASKANIQNYYDAVDESLDAQIAAQKKYLESKNLSEEEYQKTKMSIAELEREKHNNALQRMQDTQAYYEKEYSAMTYMVNEYITALSDEKETISDTYDEEIDKLQQVNNAKERSIKLTELQNNLENAQNEKKRVYRAGVGFVYEQDRAAVKKAKDELDAFYRQDQIDNLTKAKEMETKILDERIEKWNKYLDAMEKVYKTAERNHNIGILENLLGTEGWQGVFDELNSDMSNFIKEYDAGMKIYHGEWTGFLEEYEKLSTKIYDKLESSVELLKNIKEYGTFDTDPANKNVSVNGINAEYKQDDIQDYEDKNSVKSWKDRRWRNEIRDYSALFSTVEGRAIANKWGITQQDAKNMHYQKETELLSFVREYGYEELFKILRDPEINDTGYSISELKDAIAIATNNKVDLGELTHEEASTRLDYMNNQEMAKKTHVIEKLLNNTVDIASKIKGIEDGSTVRLNGVDFTKEELEEIRAEKIWMNYRSGKYDQIGADGNVDHYKTLEYIAGLADDIDGAEDKNDKGAFGTGLLGKFWDSLLEHTFGGTKIEELSQSIHALVEGQSKALDETNTTLFEVYKQSEGKVEYETTNAGGTQSSPNFNLYNYYIAKESNKLGQVMDASAQVKDITNKK